MPLVAERLPVNLPLLITTSPLSDTISPLTAISVNESVPLFVITPPIVPFVSVAVAPSSTTTEPVNSNPARSNVTPAGTVKANV